MQQLIVSYFTGALGVSYSINCHLVKFPPSTALDLIETITNEAKWECELMIFFRGNQILLPRQKKGQANIDTVKKEDFLH